MRLHANARVNSTVTQEIIQEVGDLVHQISLCNDSQVREITSNVAELDSEHKRYNRYERDGYVRPLSKKIGQRVETVTNDIGCVQKMVDCEIQYIPILSTLKTILSNLQIRELIIQGSRSKSDDGIIAAFSDGKRSQSMKIFSATDPAIKLQLSLYQDDIEVANALGANSGIYKLTMYYMIILNLPSMFNALLAHHHLVCVAMASDIKRFGHNAVTKLIVDEVKQLEEGIFIDKDIYVIGTLATITGDNLGMNSILGLVESFSATHYCRFCMLPRAECQVTTSCRIANDQARNAQEHAAHIKNPQTRETGVVRSCALDGLSYFSSIESFTPDIMHDILEGVGKLELGLILESLITKKIVTIDNFNTLLDTFDYGYTDASNKPRCLSRANNRINVRQSASRMWCLLRVMPLLIGELIPNDSPEMELFRLLREVMAYSFAPIHTTATTLYLDFIVEQHHTLFQQLYPDNPLTPKQHNLLHYGEAIRRNGPLTLYSTMRSESKHLLAKLTASSSCNFRNIPLTVSKKYQSNAFSLWFNGDIFPRNVAGSKVRESISSITYNGSTIKPGCAIIQDRQIFTVTSIKLNDVGEPDLCVVQHHAEWCNKLLAYTITPEQHDLIISPTLNTYHCGLSVWKSTQGVSCIVPKYKIDLKSEL